MRSAHLKWILNESYLEKIDSTYIKYARIISMLVKISHAHILVKKIIIIHLLCAKHEHDNHLKI
jgi:hypothetical protein